MRNDINLLSLRLFLDVAASGSFSEAARRNGLPPSSVSRHIQALEQQLGQNLLFRHTRAVTLTEIGAIYCGEVRDVLAALDLASERARGAADAPSGLLRINAPVAFGRRHIAPLLAAYQARHRQVEIDLALTDGFIDPVAESTDIVIRIGRMPDSSLTGRQLTPQRYVLAASPDYLERHGDAPTPEALPQHNCLIYKGTNGAQKWYFRQAGEAFRSTVVRGNLTSNNAESLVEAALAGQGLVLFPTWLLHEELRAGRLVALMPDREASIDTATYGIHLIYPESRLRSLKVRSFRDYLIEAIGAPPYWDRDEVR
ncbi:LysR family transcriptional regulator [Rhizobium halophytocola]|uniref:DNA-binding transcriptional LysR family regulator n=1 Tax=Rhizobium halophytocola TaxID=735519 RepID=A0ABS4DVS2_9HYPH|nr:LysR family transcriptional regulator [Rhizobium halophytocola]MBP1849794.1 DNA-binding transcriptional LysR family regulator [Rhizobium halophytocola]